MEGVMLVLDAQSTDHGSGYEATHAQEAQDSAVPAWNAVLHDCPAWKQWATLFFSSIIYLFYNHPVHLPSISPALVQQTCVISAIRKKSIKMCMCGLHRTVIRSMFVVHYLTRSKHTPCCSIKLAGCFMVMGHTHFKIYRICDIISYSGDLNCLCVLSQIDSRHRSLVLAVICLLYCAMKCIDVWVVA